ncbi:MAG TPA: PadR family transcriptional regulator [Anaerolineales bacterium]|nr:PadR family transcriptional regulator [Anaerolineales bacterium]
MSVRYAVLGLISQKPRHGYETRIAFENLVGGDENWEVKPAQIYTTLDRLEEAGLVKCSSDLGEGKEPSRRVYKITRLGEEALQEWFASPVAPGHQRDEFFIKLIIGVASGRADPERLIQTQRGLLFQEMHAATNQRDEYDPRTAIAQILLLDKVIMHLEADLRWLDMIEMRLEAIKDQPLPEPEIRPRGRPRKGDKGSTYPPPEKAVSSS